MKSPLLKLPALILAALMMMSLVACAVINPNGSGTTDPNGGANVESGDDQNYVCDLPDDLRNQKRGTRAQGLEGRRLARGLPQLRQSV